MEIRAAFGAICARSLVAARVQAKLVAKVQMRLKLRRAQQNKQQNWEERMSKNVYDTPIVKLNTPRVEDGRPLLIAGLAGRNTASTLEDIPALWERFSVHSGRIHGQVGRAAYGERVQRDGQLPLRVGRGGLRIFGASGTIQTRAYSGTKMRYNSSPRTRFETSPHGQYDLVYVAFGIEL